MTLTKVGLILHLVEETGLRRKEVTELVEHFFSGIAQSLKSGQTVKLAGLGNFVLHDKAERPGLNPKTGEPVPVTARRVVTLRAGPTLRARVEANARALLDKE